jgi:hypothetical protein
VTDSTPRTDDSYQARPIRPRSRRAGVALFLVGFVTASAIAVALTWLLFWRAGGRIDLSRPTVVQHIQQLQRLETVVYRMEKIVSGSQESAYFPRLLVGDRLLLIVYGEATAGIDLGHLDGESVAVDGAAIELTMPPAEIFSTRIDNDRTQVYARETGLFTSPDPNLESEVRRQAEREMRRAAIDGGILPSATANARLTLTTFIKGLGFETVVFR